MTAGGLEVPRRRRDELAAGRGKNPQPEPTGGPEYGATGVAAARRDRSRGRQGADQVRRRSPQEALVSGATEVGARKEFQERSPKGNFEAEAEINVSGNVSGKGYFEKGLESGATEARAAR